MKENLSNSLKTTSRKPLHAALHSVSRTKCSKALACGKPRPLEIASKYKTLNRTISSAECSDIKLGAYYLLESWY